MAAVLGGHEDIVRQLVERQDTNINTLSLTAMADAIVAGEEDLAKLFVTRKDLAINARFQEATVSPLERDCPALALASYVSLTEVVRAILARDDVNVNCYAPGLPPMLGEEVVEHATPLTLAVMGDHKEIVELLMKHPKIKPNLDNSNGYNPVMSAVVRGHVPILKTLMKHRGIGIHSFDLDGRTPLIEAVSRGYEAIVQILCQSEFLQDGGEDSTGQTALMMAASMGNERMAAMLLSHEFVETHQENSDGVTALAFAAESGHVSIVKRLLHPGFGNEGPKKRHLSQALLKATMFQHFNVIDVLRGYIKSLPKDAFQGVPDEHAAESEFESAFESGSESESDSDSDLAVPSALLSVFPSSGDSPDRSQTPSDNQIL